MVKLFTLSNCFLAALIGQAAGHFVLNYPPSVGFDDSLEGNAPCGGFSVDFSKDNITDFHVGGDVLALQSFHPQVTWLFRATLDQTASGNWTNLLPAVQQTGLNSFCEPAVQVPASFAGSKGVIGIAADSPDGILYQCAAVNFVTGVGATQASCKNETSTTASFVADAALSSLPSTASATSSGTATSSPTSSTKPSAANSNYGYGGLGMLAWVMVVGSASFLACLL
ncbi:hypothetical protein BGZ57DRAFT_754022 [Hyaloscypha finlandica]|nr:hypothetical protein BGZ57DRAFT_754022 [Hyaloscypha finlandica]KAH8806417.1 hypothetical protein F5882DRAFT_316911 [Hyaloscypha sp. PMI_1271]